MKVDDTKMFETLLSEVKSVGERISKVDVTLTRQQVILEDHIKRTELQEKALADHRELDASLFEKLGNRVKPLEIQSAMWAGAGKVLAIIGLIAGIAGAVYKIVF